MRLLLVAGAALGLAAPARADPPRWGARAEAGAEYDTNAGRVEEVEGGEPRPRVESPATRLVGSGDLGLAPGARQSLSLSGALAGRRFARDEARAEDVLVAQAGATYSAFLGERSTLSLAGAYYDVFQRRTVEARDFRSLTAALRFERAVGEGGALALGAGHRWFAYKPEPDYDFQAPTVQLAYRHALAAPDEGGAEWEISGGVSAELRRFRGARCAAGATPVCPDPGGGLRQDQFWVAHLEATRTGSFLAGAGVAVHSNRSNSFGEPLLRGVAHARAVFLLPWELSLSVRGELLATRYLDPLPLARNPVSGALVSIEEESRSTARAELVRPLGRRVDAGLRYAYYTNELGGGPVRFRRQTVVLFLALLVSE